MASNLTGQKIFDARKVKYAGRPTDGTLLKVWDECSRYEKSLYRQAAKRARHFNSIDEGYKILEQPLVNIGVVITSLENVTPGTHLSWPLEESDDWILQLLLRVNANIDFARHHVLVSRVVSRNGDVEIVHFSGLDKRSAIVKQEKLTLDRNLLMVQCRCTVMDPYDHSAITQW